MNRTLYSAQNLTLIRTKSSLIISISPNATDDSLIPIGIDEKLNLDSTNSYDPDQGYRDYSDTFKRIFACPD